MNEVESVVIRFSGDSGDGMQLTGTQFSNTSALMGNDLATFPDYPAEIRAPKGTIAGVSGFQVNIGATEISTPGDEPDVLVAMNPAALKANLDSLRKGGTVIVNIDSFTDQNLSKAGYEGTPLGSVQMESYKVVEAKITSQTVEALKDVDIDNKSKERCKNLYALGMTYFMYTRDLGPTEKWLNQKFGKKPELAQANITTLRAGYHFAETLEEQISTYKVKASGSLSPGTYRQISGNAATALGLIAGSHLSGRNLFLGTYPITPASDVLHELAKYKEHGVKTFQAEDEIAGICSAIGASFGGALAATSTSGPGLALKGEALGLAMMYEIPLVVLDVQRGGPSTGLPTKTEQSDLNIAFNGRNGESPLIILAASSPADCFHMAIEACRLTLEHMTPVVFLTDGYIANGSEPWKIPVVEKTYEKINPNYADPEELKGNYLAYKRDEKKLARQMAIPGMSGLEHRLGGLEKQDQTGNVSYDPANHEYMCKIRQEKIDRVADFIPEQEVEGEQTGDLLIVSWGGTYGATHAAVKACQEKGHKISLAHIKYLNPFPKNFESLLGNFKKVLIPELNNGQLKNLINGRFNCNAAGYNKMQGLPFMVRELVGLFEQHLEEL